MESGLTGRTSSLSSKLATLAAALGIMGICARATGMFGPGYPTLTTPLPLPVVLPAMLLDSRTAYGFVPFAAGFLFCIWSWPLLLGIPVGRGRTAIAAALVACLSAAWFWLGWMYGIKYEGFQFTVVTALFSLSFAVLIGALLMSKRAGTFRFSLAANFLLFAWVVTYAFPYLGELP